MSTTSDQMRAWKGPALFSYGFRPFFLCAGLWAALAMLLWIAILAGAIALPTAFDPVSWHAHEFLFGYLGAVAAGFMLTAVPNWTGRLPIVGWPLAGLTLLWALGRIVIGISGYISPLVVALIDLAFPVALAAVLTREIVAGRNWRNLAVPAMLGVFTAGNALFHWQAAQGDFAAGGEGLRLGLAAAVMMISVIGGRIVPSFTRNWLARRDHAARPKAFGRFDRIVLVATAVTLLAWVAAPALPGTGVALILAGILQFARLARWSGRHTLSEPLVWILHVGYAFIPLGAMALGVATFVPGASMLIAAQHLWMAGAIAVMTLAVMTRATLGHTSQSLVAGTGTTSVYVALLASVLVRCLAGIAPDWTAWLYWLSGGLWVSAYLGFAVVFGPALVGIRPSHRMPA